jgi:hypothetical protein
MLSGKLMQTGFMSSVKEAILARRRCMKFMLTGIRIIGIGIWVAILSMAISALFFRHGTEEDATLVFVIIMDLLVFLLVAKGILNIFRNQRG